MSRAFEYRQFDPEAFDCEFWDELNKQPEVWTPKPPKPRPTQQPET